MRLIFPSVALKSLSSDLDTWKLEIRANLKKSFKIIDDFNREATKFVFSIKHCLPSEKQRWACATNYVRALELFQSAVLLAERGAITSARTLVRSCAETAILMGGIANDPVTTLPAIVEDHHKTISSYANAFLSDPVFSSSVSQAETKTLRDTVAEAWQRYPNGPKPLIWEQVAKKGKTSDLYMLIYRMTSTDASHASAISVERHIRVDTQGKASDLAFGPVGKEVLDTLSIAMNSMLHAMKAAADVFLEENLSTIVSHWFGEWRKLDSLIV